MAEYKFTAALNAAGFPFVTRFQPRNIIVAGMDNRLRNPATTAQSNQDNNPANLPQVLYVENILPTEDGIQSVGFNQLQNQVAGETQFDEVYILRDENEATSYFAPARGKNYITSGFGVAWAQSNPLAGAPVANDVSVAYVNGQTYICYSGLKLFRWDGVSLVDESAALVGVAIADVRYIVGAGNYLIAACADLSIKWSSLVNPLDFAPSLSTGAGSQIPLDLRGPVKGLTSIAGGFIIHCLQNAVAAMYTNNANSPFTFREIPNAGGITTKRLVATDVSGAVYQWSNNGLQRLGLRECESLFPTVADYFTGRLHETFDTNTNLLSITRLTASQNFFVKVAFIAGRFLVLSYGITADGYYSYALIYDNLLKRWGKVKREHTDCFSRFSDARQSICFVTDNGSVYEVVLDHRALTDSGVVILGRYQLNRSSLICSQEVELEVTDSQDNPSVTVIANYNGTTAGEQHAMVAYVNTDNYRSFQKQIEAVNLSYVIKGTFTLNTVLLTHTRGAGT